MLVKKKNMELWKRFVESLVWHATRPRGQRCEEDDLF